MSGSEKAPQPPVPGLDIATRIYVELIGRSYLRVENAAVIKPDPLELARLSFKLAGEFLKAEAEIKAEAGPKNVGYDVTQLDLSKL
jgi:hypothetical protein